MEVATPQVSAPVKRKLTTILAADVESYTRLMRDNEEATLKTLGEYREIIDGLILRHDGRIFSTAGDSVLAEFGSTVEAVRCAIAFQEEITARNTQMPSERRLRYRIGLNVGDVMAKGEALYGDGVNVAARLEGLAESGGICLSAAVFEQVKHKMSLGFQEMGAQEVKNINEPITVYRLVSAPISVDKPAKRRRPEKTVQAEPDRPPRRRGIPAKKTLLFGLVVAIAVVWFDSGTMPGVRQACGYVDTMMNTVREYGSSSSLASRARQQESWSFRFDRLWIKARKKLCY